MGATLFLLVALLPGIQSHRVYSSVHLILFIGFKAFAGVSQNLINFMGKGYLDDTCGPSVYWPIG